MSVQTPRKCGGRSARSQWQTVGSSEIEVAGAKLAHVTFEHETSSVALLVQVVKSDVVRHSKRTSLGAAALPDSDNGTPSQICHYRGVARARSSAKRCAREEWRILAIQGPGRWACAQALDDVEEAYADSFATAVRGSANGDWQLVFHRMEMCCSLLETWSDKEVQEATIGALPTHDEVPVKKVVFSGDTKKKRLEQDMSTVPTYLEWKMPQLLYKCEGSSNVSQLLNTD